MGVLFMLCCGALFFTPEVPSHHSGGGALRAVKGVVGDLRNMMKTKGGLLAAIVVFLPLGTGTAQGVLTQAKVAAFWGAGEHEVETVQGLLSGLVTAIGCFAGGWLCHRLRPQTAYASVGLVLALTAVAIAGSPPTVTMYVAWNLIYAFGVGLAYAAFTAVCLDAMGSGSGATKYNVYASLSNFPIWWLGLVLGAAADKWGARTMLVTEAGFAVVGVAMFYIAVALVRRSPRLA
jgi:hypothetical protein